MADPVKVKIPFGKVAAFVAKFVTKAKNGFTKEEGDEILADFVELLADVLKQSV